MRGSETGVVQGSFPQGLQRARQVLQASRDPLPRPAPAAPGAVAFPVSPRWLPQGPGQPLPPALQARMEGLFRTGLSDVRVHVGPEVAGLGALALAHGSHLYFASGRYDPASPAGQRLIAHELTHVVQQKAGRVSNPFGRGLALVQDPLLEAEAERMAVRATAPAVPPPAARAVAQHSPAPHGRRVLQARWDPVNGKDYEVWDQVIDGRRWYRRGDVGRYVYHSEPADREPSRIKIFLLPTSIHGGVPQDLLPPPLPQIQIPTFSNPFSSGGTLMPPPSFRPSSQSSSSQLMPPPSFLPPSKNNNNSTFKMPSLPPPKSLGLSGGPPPLSSQFGVLNAGSNTLVTLARGCNSDEQFNAILQNGTAGGAPATSNPSAPSNQQAVEGVAFEGAPWQVSEERQMARRRVDYTEYSTNPSVTQSFGSRGGVVVIRIARKWLVQGSGSENGWFINDNMPVTILWSRGAQSESQQKLKSIKISTTQSEAEDYRKNHPGNNDGDNGGGFIF